MVLQWHVLETHRIDPCIDSVRVRSDRTRVGRADLSLRCPWKTKRSLDAIHLERASSGELGEPPRCGAGGELELEQAVAGDDVAEGAGRVFDRAGEDVGNAAVVVHDAH